MRFVFVGVVASALVAATASLAGAADAVDVQSRIDAVTVFPSGAEVVRTARVKIPQGAGTLVFKDLPAEAVAQSIRVDGKSTGELEIGTVDVRRLFVPQHDGAQSENERKQIEKEIVALVREKIGPVAAFKHAVVVQRLPKTRSGKILRGTMKKIAEGQDAPVPATIEDPAVLDEIRAALEAR